VGAELLTDPAWNTVEKPIRNILAASRRPAQIMNELRKRPSLAASHFEIMSK
jgi:hypothetical protein